MDQCEIGRLSSRIGGIVKRVGEDNKRTGQINQVTVYYCILDSTEKGEQWKPNSLSLVSHGAFLMICLCFVICILFGESSQELLLKKDIF